MALPVVDPTPKYFKTSDGGQFGLHVGRWDEHHRRRRTVLPERGSPWDYAPLIDIIRPATGIREFRYVGLTVQEWLERLRSRRDPQHEGAVAWYLGRFERVRRKLDQRSRVPDSEYTTTLAEVPVMAALPSAVSRFGPKLVTVSEWRAMLLGLSSRGVRGEELQRSGLIRALEILEGKLPDPSRIGLKREQILRLIDLDHLRPRIVVECRHGFDTKSGWRECCDVVRARQGRRRGAIGNGRNELRVIRYRHRTFGWSLIRLTRFPDLLRDREDHWQILDEHGKPVLPAKAARLNNVESVMAAAESAMAEHFGQWHRGIESLKWRAYSLPGGDGYRELLVQLHDWPNNYQPRHYRARNVLFHLRTSMRTTPNSKRVLYLDEVQSDWHADASQETRGGQRRHRTLPTPTPPFAKEWPLLAMKIALWWAQRQAADGLAWSTAELQRLRWGKRGPPESLYGRELPDAAAQLARVLSLEVGQAALRLRSSHRYVELAERGWIVCGPDGVPHTKPFRHREQAECFADQTGEFCNVEVPCLWLGSGPRMTNIPLFGAGSADIWFGATSKRSS